MRVLVACEFSGIVREAFRAKGHDAISCDLLPTERPGPHIQGDVLDILDDGWDMMIAHPPCTYLSYAATHCWDAPGREALRQDAMDFFMALYNAPVSRVCIENPVGYPNTKFRTPDQIVHPYYFGDNDMKRTCLWLRGLPKLYHISETTLFERKTHTRKPEPIYHRRGSGEAIHFTEAKHGGHERSRFFQGIADAMAEQWGVE